MGLLRSDGESLSEPEYLLLRLWRPAPALKLICGHKLRQRGRSLRFPSSRGRRRPTCLAQFLIRGSR